MERNIISMSPYDYYMKKKLGYFAFQDVKFLESKHLEALNRFFQREDYGEILWLIQQHCQLEMKTLMQSVKKGKKDLNSHYIKNELADLFYTYTTKLAKELVFDMCRVTGVCCVDDGIIRTFLGVKALSSSYQ